MKCTSKEEFDACMEKHKEYLGARYLELFEATAGEWTRLNGAASQLPNAPVNENSSVVLLRGLPYGATEERIREFFSDIKLVAVYLIKDHMGRASGHAYVELESEAVLEEALQKDKQYIDDRYIELFKSTVPDLIKALRKSQQNMEQINQNYFRLQPGHYAQPNPLFGSNTQKPFCVRMRGMPYNTTEGQIISFFKEVNVTPSRIHRKADGSEAYIEFRTIQERELAMSKQRSFIGNRYIDLFICDYDVIAARISGPIMPAGHPGVAAHPHHPGYAPHQLYPSYHPQTLEPAYHAPAPPPPAAPTTRRGPVAGYGGYGMHHHQPHPATFGGPKAYHHPHHHPERMAYPQNYYGL